MIRPNSAKTFGVSPDDPDLVTCERPELPRSDDPDLGISECVFAFSVPTPDDPGIPWMMRAPPKNTQRSLSGVGVYIPLHPHPSFLSLSLSPTNLDSKTLNHPLPSILELDSCKETPRD